MSYKILLVLMYVQVLIKCEIFNFPEGFKFGAASASYQIEGAWNLDGKTPNIWDTFTHNHPEYIADSSNGDVSADSYHFYKKDIEALKYVGFHYYRFSMSWSRIIPDGRKINMKAIKYYNEVINELLSKQIEPMITIYHWDLPQYIQDLGGWTNPLIVNYFEHFADVLFEKFGARIKNWITFNEPFNFCIDGYGTSRMAPNINASGVGEYLCTHHVLQSHAVAYRLYRRKYFKAQRGLIGISLNTRYFYPAENISQSFSDKAQEFRLGWFAHPIFTKSGGYPTVMIDEIGNKSVTEGYPWSRLPTMTDEMMNSLRGSADFLAINYYTSRIVAPKRKDENNAPSFENDSGLDYLIDETWQRAKSVWLYVVPQGLYDLLNWIKINYDNPTVIITENGFSDDGELNDQRRISYFKQHLAAVSKAIVSDGCNVAAYTAWSITDNFEWIQGYTEKFGLYSVNMTSTERERTPKESAKFFKKLIQDTSFEL